MACAMHRVAVPGGVVEVFFHNNAVRSNRCAFVAQRLMGAQSSQGVSASAASKSGYRSWRNTGFGRARNVRASIHASRVDSHLE
eukprot:353803-Chlamydomonas_euryale.AAC.1